jgi:hypothetical protein
MTVLKVLMNLFIFLQKNISYKLSCYINNLIKESMEQETWQIVDIPY